MAIMMTSSTTIEVLLKEALEKERLEFKEQYRVYEKGNGFHPKYVVDFLVTHGKKSIIVECDSFSFHVSDKDVESGIRRDAWLESCGYAVLHFTAAQLKYEMATVMLSIKHHLGIINVPTKALTFQGRAVRKEYIVNRAPKEKLHKVSLYYNYTRLKDKVWVVYKFRDDTVKKCSEERIKIFHNVPEKAADLLAVYAALLDLKRSVNLTVYCFSGWLTGYLNKTIEKRRYEQPILTKVEKTLKNHNYLVKHINKSRGPEYYNWPKTEQLITRELHSRCMQIRHKKEGALDGNSIDFASIEQAND